MIYACFTQKHNPLGNISQETQIIAVIVKHYARMRVKSDYNRISIPLMSLVNNHCNKHPVTKMHTIKNAHRNNRMPKAQVFISEMYFHSISCYGKFNKVR